MPADPISPAPPCSPLRSAHLRASAGQYGHALAGAGGQQVRAQAHPDDKAAVCVALYASPPYDLHVPALPVSRLSITLTAAPVSGGFDGDRARHYQSARHALFLTPAGTAAHWRKAAPSRHLNIYFHPDAFGGEVPDEGRLGGDQAPLLNGAMPGLRPLVDGLVAELDGSDPLAAEAADCLSRLLLVRLARHRMLARDAACPLRPAVLARLCEYVEAHLAERILVTDLARVAGLSPNHFAHAFTQRTGQAPHQFVLQRRLARAADLLRQGRLPLAQVAAASGFASQQHLTHTMRQRLGITPGRMRQAVAVGSVPTSVTPCE